MSNTTKIWFIIFNGVQVVVSGFMFFVLLNTIFQNYNYNGYVNDRQVITMFISFLLICTASYNLFLAVKYKGGFVQRRFSWPLSILSLCYNGGIAVLIVIITCYGAYIEFFDGSSSEDIIGKVMVFVVASWALVSILIFKWQLQLIKKIKRTNELQLESLIDSIGIKDE